MTERTTSPPLTPEQQAILDDSQRIGGDVAADNLFDSRCHPELSLPIPGPNLLDTDYSEVQAYVDGD